MSTELFEVSVVMGIFRRVKILLRGKGVDTVITMNRASAKEFISELQDAIGVIPEETKP